MESREDFISYKKVLLFGDEGTGKTSFINRLETREFNESVPHTSDNVKEYQIKTEIKGGKYLNINIYEIRPENDIINNINLLEAFLFDCPCALFFIDITNPNMKIIIVENKSDLECKKPNENMNKYINDNPDIDHIIISIKNGNNLDELLLKIYNEINSPNKLIPVNQVSRNAFKSGQKKELEGDICLILLGNSMVGKTNFFTRYFMNEFNPINTMTVGINSACKLIKINDKDLYKLTLYDTAGQERYKSLPGKYFKNADGVLLLFDLIDKTSFDQVNEWINTIKEFSADNVKNENDIVIYLIGNKLDLVEKDNEVISVDDKNKLIKQLGIKYYEISCKWNLNIEDVMARIILDCDKNLKKKERRNIGSFSLVKDTHQSKSKNVSKNRSECCGGNNKK